MVNRTGWWKVGVVMVWIAGWAGNAVAGDGKYSRIGDQLVPVGEHNKYTYDYDPWNISTNPLGYMFGIFTLGLSHAMGDHVAVRGDVDLYVPYETRFRGAGASLGLPIYFRKMYDGFFLELGGRVFGGKFEGESEYAVFYGPQTLLGWHWIWDSGFNIALAMGAGYTWMTVQSEGLKGSDEASMEGVLPAGYLRFGKTF